MNGQEDSERSNLITNDSLTLSVSYEVIPRNIASSSVNMSRVMSDQSQGPAENNKDQLGSYHKSVCKDYYLVCVYNTDKRALVVQWSHLQVGVLPHA